MDSQEREPAPAPVAVGGVAYQWVGESTIEHDYLTLAAVRAAGLDKAGPEPGEDPGDFIPRILAAAALSGRLWELFGCLVAPEGCTAERWTPEVGRATAEHLRRVTDPADKQAVQGLVVAALLGFFEAGRGSSPTSRSSSDRPGSVCVVDPATAVTGAPETTGTGDPLSGC